jgi:splicing factor 3A subunit 1
MEVVEPTEVLPAPVLADVKQGKVTGIIIPPPDIRAVVDKTAQFVARNGKSFEARISNSAEGKTAKFNFMKPFDPYHAYYESKISEFEESINKPKDNIIIEEIKQQPIEEDLNSKVITSAVPIKSSTSKKASLTTPIARFAMNKPTEASHAFEFSLGHPSGLSAVDVDIIKLTAQYTSVNGREFLSGLAQREQRNPQFDFLKPTHVLFSYFTSLVDAYARVLLPSSELKERIQLKSDKMRVLEGCVQRWEWTRADEDRKNRDSAEADAERIAFQSIDWMEFVVVETIGKYIIINIVNVILYIFNILILLFIRLS